MELKEVKDGDVVVVGARRSKYYGQTGVVEGWTRSKASAYVRLRDGRKATVRVGSLRVVVGRKAEPKVREGDGVVSDDNQVDGRGEVEALVNELRKLRVEVAGLKEVLSGIEVLMAGEVE